jgi:ABC-type uncharacterized transport system permease subunit
MSRLFLYPTLLFYLGCGITIALRLFLRDAQRIPPRNLALSLGFAGVLGHAVLLYHSAVSDVGLDLGFFSALALAAWTAVILLLVSALTKPVENLGIVLFPLAALMLWLQHSGLGLDGGQFSTRLLGPQADWGLKIHVLVSLLAYSLLTLASVQAVLLAIQDHHLHRRQPGGFIRALPPLQTMESLLFEMIGTGFALLTLSLLSGSLFLEDMFAQHLVHKTVLSVIGWVVFGILLLGRFRAGWRGRTAIIWTLSGFVVLILAYFGSKAVLELILKR